MGRPPKYVDEVERLLDDGWTVQNIVKNTNISQATVYRTLSKLKKQARWDFKNLMSEDYLWVYQKTLENYNRTVRECNEEIEVVKNTYGAIQYQIMEALEKVQKSNKPQAHAESNLLANLITCQSSRTNELIKLTAQRDKATDMKGRLLNDGPYAHAIDQWINKNPAAKGSSPTIMELKKIDNEDPNISVSKEEPPRLNISPSNDSDDDSNDDDTHEPTAEDLEVLKEMKEDNKED